MESAIGVGRILCRSGTNRNFRAGFDLQQVINHFLETINRDLGTRILFPLLHLYKAQLI